MKPKKNQVSASDVAAEILRILGSMSTMKLQKLVYYCQAWSLAWDEVPLFKEPIEAWSNGPIVPALFKLHRGKFEVDSWSEGDISKLSETQKETIASVAKFYGQKSGHWLSELTHQELPWCEARRGLSMGERGNKVIELETMQQYYGGLL